MATLENVRNSVTLRSHGRGKVPFKVQDKPMGHHTTGNKNFYAVVLDSTLHLTFKKLLLGEFWCSDEQYPQLSVKAIKHDSLFQLGVW